VINIVQSNRELSISHFDQEGEVEISRIEIPKSEMFGWAYAKKTTSAEPELLSWDGKRVRKRRSEYIDERGIDKFRLEEFLLQAPKEFREKIYEFNPPKKFFCDIEVEVTEGFPTPDIAPNPITTIAYATEKDSIVVFGTKALSVDQQLSIHKRLNVHFEKFGREINFKYYFFNSERDMLYTFFAKALRKMSLVTGWNFMGFDWPYLVNRAKRLQIDPALCSITGTLTGKNDTPQHKLVVDYLDIYKKWDRVVDIKESNSLDYVSKAALGVQKVKSNLTLTQQYEQEYDTYVFYNAADAYLVRLLDEKLNTMNTFLLLGNITKVEAMKAFSPVHMAEATFARVAYEHNRVIVPKKLERKSSDELVEQLRKIPGGYVSVPEPGFHHWVACFDFASLYPHIMMEFNISPEKFLGQIENLDPMFLKGRKVIQTASGAVFDHTEDSYLKKILKDTYGMRKESKKRAMEIEQEIAYLQSFL
jgi:DNA polymerase elongation subunit (family B)